MLDKPDYLYLVTVILAGVIIVIVALWSANVATVNEYTHFITECRLLEISMETCERLAAKVLGG